MATNVTRSIMHADRPPAVFGPEVWKSFGMTTYSVSSPEASSRSDILLITEFV